MSYFADSMAKIIEDEARSIADDKIKDYSLTIKTTDGHILDIVEQFNEPEEITMIVDLEYEGLHE